MTAGGAGLEAAEVEVLLCDADGNLFPSEEPAFDAAAEVTNRLMAELALPERYSGEELRRHAIGRNFRSIVLELAECHGVSVDARDLERWVEEERREVTSHLARTLEPQPEVLSPIEALGGRFRLAAVSSSALKRLDACFEASGLAHLFPPDARFSAEDSLPVPTSKPDPAVYAHAGEVLGVSGARGLAIEDAATGVSSAVAAGFPTVGNLVFVPAGEREERAQELRAAGAETIVESWEELGAALGMARA